MEPILALLDPWKFSTNVTGLPSSQSSVIQFSRWRSSSLVFPSLVRHNWHRLPRERLGFRSKPNRDSCIASQTPVNAHTIALARLGSSVYLFFCAVHSSNPAQKPIVWSREFFGLGTEVGDVLVVKVLHGVVGLDQSNVAVWDPSDLGEVVWDDSFDLTKASTQQIYKEQCERYRSNSERVLDVRNLLCPTALSRVLLSSRSGWLTCILCFPSSLFYFGSRRETPRAGSTTLVSIYSSRRTEVSSSTFRARRHCATNCDNSWTPRTKEPVRSRIRKSSTTLACRRRRND